MTHPNRRRRWATIVHTIRQMPFDASVTALQSELADFDGFPARGDSAGRGSSELTVVESLAMQLGPMHRDAEAIDRCLAAIESEISRLATVIARRSGPTPAYVKMPCEVATYHEPWAMPKDGETSPCPEEMEYHPSGTPRHEHLCAKHRKRKERWERNPTPEGEAA